MNRETLTQGISEGFGSPAYAKEELRAEISAMMTGERVGVGHDPSRGAAYVEGWIAALEEDPREIRRAAADCAEDLRLRALAAPRARGRARTRGRGRDPRAQRRGRSSIPCRRSPCRSGPSGRAADGR